MGYKIEWLKKKLFMVMDLTETHPTYEVEKKHSAIAKRFQVCFCQFFNDIFGGWLVESTGWTFVYPFVGVHDLCTREESGVYCVHHAYICEFTGLYLRTQPSKILIDHLWKSLAYEILNMRGNKGDLPDFLY